MHILLNKLPNHYIRKAFQNKIITNLNLRFLITHLSQNKFNALQKIRLFIIFDLLYFFTYL